MRFIVNYLRNKPHHDSVRLLICVAGRGVAHPDYLYSLPQELGNYLRMTG